MDLFVHIYHLPYLSFAQLYEIFFLSVYIHLLGVGCLFGFWFHLLGSGQQYQEYFFCLCILYV